MKVPYFVLLIVSFLLVSFLDNDEYEVQAKLANEYAEMLSQEQECKTLQCLGDF